MLDALLYSLLTIAVCFLMGAILYCSKQVGFWAATLWLAHSALLLLRRMLRRFDWEKLSTLVLALSLALVVTLTATVPVSVPTEPCDPACAEHCTIHEGETKRDLYQALQTAFSVFEGDSADFREHLTAAAKEAESKWAAWGLKAGACLLPLLIPISAAAATVTLLWNFLPHHVPILSATWYIFSGLDPYSIRMAKSIHEDLRKKKKTGVFIFLRTNRRKISEDDLAEIRRINYHLYSGDEARFLRFYPRRFRRMRFFFLSETTDENFERIQEFLEAVKNKWLFCPLGKPRNDVFRQELYLLSETESAPMLIDHLRDTLYREKVVTVTRADGTTEQKKEKVKRLVFSNTELRLLDRFRATSYDLLRNAPLHAHIDKSGQKDQLHVLILGFGKIGREFFRTACSLGIFPDCKTEFTICDQLIEQKLHAFLCQCPELNSSVSFRGTELDAETDQLDTLIYNRQFHYILVALGDDERNIRVASRLKRFYRRSHWNHEARKQAGLPCAPDIQPQICVNIEDSIKHDYTQKLWTEASQRDNAKSWDKSLHIFGGLDQVFTPKVLMPRNLWTAARFIHRKLNSMMSDEHLNWGEYERRSSIACAVRAEYLAASNPTASPAKLADTEHLRWMAYVRSEGLRYADTNLVDVYYDRDNGRHVDILGKLTPCLTTDQTKLDSVWTHLSTGKYTNDYKDKRSFRQRDLYLVERSHEIAEILEV